VCRRHRDIRPGTRRSAWSSVRNFLEFQIYATDSRGETSGPRSPPISRRSSLRMTQESEGRDHRPGRQNATMNSALRRSVGMLGASWVSFSGSSSTSSPDRPFVIITAPAGGAAVVIVMDRCCNAYHAVQCRRHGRGSVHGLCWLSDTHANSVLVIRFATRKLNEIGDATRRARGRIRCA